MRFAHQGLRRGVRRLAQGGVAIWGLSNQGAVLPTAYDRGTTTAEDRRV